MNETQLTGKALKEYIKMRFPLSRKNLNPNMDLSEMDEHKTSELKLDLADNYYDDNELRCIYDDDIREILEDNLGMEILEINSKPNGVSVGYEDIKGNLKNHIDNNNNRVCLDINQVSILFRVVLNNQDIEEIKRLIKTELGYKLLDIEHKKKSIKLSEKFINGCEGFAGVEVLK